MKNVKTFKKSDLKTGQLLVFKQVLDESEKPSILHRGKVLLGTDFGDILNSIDSGVKRTYSTVDDYFLNPNWELIEVYKPQSPGVTPSFYFKNHDLQWEVQEGIDLTRYPKLLCTPYDKAYPPKETQVLKYDPEKNTATLLSCTGDNKGEVQSGIIDIEADLKIMRIEVLDYLIK